MACGDSPERTRHAGQLATAAIVAERAAEASGSCVGQALGAGFEEDPGVGGRDRQRNRSRVARCVREERASVGREVDCAGAPQISSGAEFEGELAVEPHFWRAGYEFGEMADGVRKKFYGSVQAVGGEGVASRAAGFVSCEM